MSVDEGRRLLLHDAAREASFEVPGADATLVLMEMLPPSGWGDVATRQQLEAHEIATRQQLEAVGERFEAKLDQLRSDVRTLVAEGQTRTIQWIVTTMIALVAVTTGVATAIARLG